MSRAKHVACSVRCMLLAGKDTHTQTQTQFVAHDSLSVFVCRVTSIGVTPPTAAATAGCIVTGLSDGIVRVWNAASLLGDNGMHSSDDAALVSSVKKHAHAVSAVDVLHDASRPLLATGGAAGSEIFVWDLNRPGTLVASEGRIRVHRWTRLWPCASPSTRSRTHTHTLTRTHTHTHTHAHAYACSLQTHAYNAHAHAQHAHTHARAHTFSRFTHSAITLILLRHLSNCRSPNFLTDIKLAIQKRTFWGQERTRCARGASRSPLAKSTRSRLSHPGLREHLLMCFAVIVAMSLHGRLFKMMCHRTRVHGSMSCSCQLRTDGIMRQPRFAELAL